MKSILLTHARNYPLMEPTDAVKLIYQNEFGGGHLIRDEEACLHYLRQEYHSVCQKQDMPLFEEIGNHVVRVNLAALDAHHVDVMDLGAAFIRSAAHHKGTPDSFRAKLAILTELTQEGYMPFSTAELEQYLDSYESAGFPAVSHSDAYRAAYHPAYRVADKNYLSKQLFQQMP